MTWGLGYGLGQGAGPLVPTPDPVAKVAGPPVTFDFSDEPDGPWPFSPWEFFVVQNVGGLVSGIPEPTPDQFFSVRDGYGWWRFQQSPVSGDPFDRRGYLASPGGIVTSDNVEILIVFRTPTSVLDDTQQQLLAEFALVVRGDDDLSDYFGGRVSAEWNAGVWTQPLELQAIQAQGAAPVALSTAPPPDLPRPTDLWDAGPDPGLAELKVTVRDTTLTVELNGVLQTSAQITRNGLRKIGIFSRLERVDGTGNRESVPSILSISVRSLRDFQNLCPPVSLPGSKSLESYQISSIYFLPLREWLQLKIVARQGSRAFRVQCDVEADVLGNKYKFNAGDVIRAVEPYVGQEFTKAVADLYVARVEG